MREERNPRDKEKEDSYAHVLKYTGMFGGVQGLKILVNIVRNKLATMLLHRVGLGLNAIFMNIGELINSCTNCGISFSSVQRISELYEEGTDEDIRKFVGVIRTWALWTAVLGASLCVLCAQLLNNYYFDGSGESHTLEIIFLSLFVASMPIEASECAILKGMRQLRKMAMVEVAVAFSTVCCTIPLYYFFGLRGIAVALVLSSWAIALIHLSVTTRMFPYRVHLFSKQVINAGTPLIKKGVPYMLAAIAGSVTTAAVFGLCLADVAQVGLYKAGYGLMVTYAGMVFVAVEADYFPRLSSVNHDRERMNHTINQQIDVCVLLMAPLLIGFVMVMPWVVRLLYTSEILPIVSMAQCAVFYMFFKAVTTPIAYTSLAKGDSLMYLLMECIYDIVFVAILYWGYKWFGLFGSGVALSLAALFDLVMISTVYGARYGFRLRMSSWRLIVPQGLFLASTVLASLSGVTLIKYSVGLPCFILSVFLTFKMLSRESQIVQKVRNKLKR